MLFICSVCMCRHAEVRGQSACPLESVHSSHHEDLKIEVRSVVLSQWSWWQEPLPEVSLFSPTIDILNSKLTSVIIYYI